MARKHHTKNKGDIGNLKSQAKMAELGYTILVPITEHEVFDFAAYKDGKFLRIQSKYSSMHNGCIKVSLRTSWADKNGSHSTYVDKDQIDWFCVYCPDTGEVYIVDHQSFDNKNAIILRVEPPKNNQIKNVNLAEHYLEPPDQSA